MIVAYAQFAQFVPFTERPEFWQIMVALFGAIAVIVGAMAYRIKRDSDTKLEHVKGEVADNRAQSESQITIIKAWQEESTRAANERVKSNEMIGKQTDALTVLAGSVKDIASGINDTSTTMKNLPDALADATSRAVGKVVTGMADNIDDRFAKLETDMKELKGMISELLALARPKPAAPETPAEPLKVDIVSMPVTPKESKP